jgi:hypothetical protein
VYGADAGCGGRLWPVAEVAVPGEGSEYYASASSGRMPDEQIALLKELRVPEANIIPGRMVPMTVDIASVVDQKSHDLLARPEVYRWANCAAIWARTFTLAAPGWKRWPEAFGVAQEAVNFINAL